MISYYFCLMIEGSGSVSLTNGSGSGWPKNINPPDPDPQHCLAVLRIRDVYPGSWFLPIPEPGSRIPVPKTATKERRKKISSHIFFCSHKFYKIVNYFIIELMKKQNFGLVFKEFLPKYLSLTLKNMGLGSEIRNPEKNLFYVLLTYIIYVMQSRRFSQCPAFLSRKAKQRDKKYIVKSPERYKM